MAPSMKPIRSSAPNSVLPLRAGRLTTADDDLVEQLGRAPDDVEVAVGDRVVGARAEGDAVVRCHGCG